MTGGQALKVSPNPFNDSFTVTYRSDEADEIRLLVMDMLGNVLVEREYRVLRGSNDFLIRLDKGMGNGVLQVVVVDSGGQVDAEKLIRMSSNGR